MIPDAALETAIFEPEALTGPQVAAMASELVGARAELAELRAEAAKLRKSRGAAKGKGKGAKLKPRCPRLLVNDVAKGLIRPIDVGVERMALDWLDMEAALKRAGLA